MLALAAANAVGVVLFAALYAAAGAQLMSQHAFLGCLTMLLALVTAVWVRTERRHRELEPLRRIGRAAFGLAAVIVVAPVAVLTPLFWLDSQLPPDAGLTPWLGRIMALTLIALLLLVVVNVLGSLIIVGATLLGRWTTSAPRA